MSDLRTVVSDHWHALDGQPRRSTWMTSALPVTTAGSAVLCAIGPEGKRHLLVPALSGQVVQPDTRAGGVHLLPLTLEWDEAVTSYANLVLLREDLAEVFTGLCADVIAALETERATDSLVVVAQVLDAWHELFRNGGKLGIEQLAGLFGELTFLNSLLDLDATMLKAWKGPMRSPHDFVANGWAAEVKATASSEGKAVRIHGLDQLDVPTGGDLMLVWMRLDSADASGDSFPELVEALSRRLSRPQDLWHLIARAGYLIADRDKYESIRFTVTEQAAYRVTEDFPRIVPSSFAPGLPAGLSNVRYTVDLDCGPAPMQKDEIDEFMIAMTER